MPLFKVIKYEDYIIITKNVSMKKNFLYSDITDRVGPSLIPLVKEDPE